VGRRSRAAGRLMYIRSETSGPSVDMNTGCRGNLSLRELCQPRRTVASVEGDDRSLRKYYVNSHSKATNCLSTLCISSSCKLLVASAAKDDRAREARVRKERRVALGVVAEEKELD